MGNISEKILDAIQIITDKSIQQLKFDKTIQAEVIKQEDAASGKYKVQYNGDSFSAFANDLTYTYDVGDRVFVKIPEGDFSNKKFIENKVSTKTIDFTFDELTTKVTPIGEPFISKSNMNYGVDAHAKNDTAIVINEKVEPPISNFYKAFQVNVVLETLFGEEVFSGDYGLNIYVNSNATPYQMSWRDSINGDPFPVGQGKVTLSTVYSITDLDGLKSIDKVELYWKNKEQGNIELDNTKEIICTDLGMQFVEVLDLSGIPYYLQITNPSAETLKGTFYVNGKVIKDEEWEATWFVQDLSVTFNENYNDDAGYGWKKLADGKSITYKTNTFTKAYKLIAKYQVPNRETITRSATIDIIGTENLDLRLQQEDNVLRVVGADLSKAESFNWYIAPSDGSYRHLDSTTSSIDISNYITFSSIVIYCDVKDKDKKSIAFLSSAYANNKSSDITVSFVGDTTIKYGANGVFTPEEAARARRLRAIINWGDMIPPAPGSYKIEWVAPNGASLATGAIVSGLSDSMLTNLSQDADNVLYFSVQRSYDLNRINNFVILRITTPTKVHQFKKEIDFVRDGDAGTNGTQYSAAIVYCDDQGNELNGYQGLLSNAQPKQVKINLFEDGNLIDDLADWRLTWSADNLNLTNTNILSGRGIPQQKDDLIIQADFTIKDNEYILNAHWDAYPGAVKYRYNIQDKQKVENGGWLGAQVQEALTFSRKMDKPGDYQIAVQPLDSKDKDLLPNAAATTNITIFQSYNVATIAYSADNEILDTHHCVYCEASNGEVTIHAALPVDIIVGDSLPSEEVFAGWGNIPSFIQYQAGGCNPLYSTDLLQYLSLDIDKNLLKLNESKNKLIGTILKYRNGIGPYLNPPADITTLGKTKPVLKLQFNDLIIYHTIYTYINTYGNEAINGWGGNTDISTDNGYILAPLVGAGSKDGNNKFTGVLLGKVDQGNRTEHGIYGYRNGELTFSINEYGNAYFKGKIVAGEGEIAGWKINKNSLTAVDKENGTISINANGSISGSNGKTGSEAKSWSIKSDGTVNFNSGTFTGTVNATDLSASKGKIGGWTIESSYLIGGNTYLHAGGSISGPGWSIDSAGSAYFNNITNATITNAIITNAVITNPFFNLNQSGTGWSIFQTDSSGSFITRSFIGWYWTTFNGAEVYLPMFK